MSRRNQVRVRFLLVVLVSCLGCSDAPAGNDGGSDGGTLDVIGPFSHLDPIEASDYDCTSPTTPDRITTAPVDCLIDRACEDLLVVGHRGTGGDFGLYTPENSLSSIRLAILLGVDSVEIDVRETADDGLVLMHDGTLTRTTGVEENTNEKTLAELLAIPLLSGEYHGDFSCETIPNFADVLTMVRDRVSLTVDTKTSRGDLVAIAIRDAGMIDQAVISVSNPEVAALARATVPEVRIQLRPDTIEAYRDMEGMFTRPAEVLEVPESQLGAFMPVAAETGARLFSDIFFRDFTVFVEGKVEVYDIPFAMGAQTVQTEFPSWFLERHGRRTWGRLPTARTFSIDSPLLP